MIIRDNNSGITLLMSVLILSTLMVVVVAVSEITMTVGKSSREIGQSEIAYFAAESAVERALYPVEKLLTVDGLNGSGTLSSSQGSWTRTVTQNTQAPHQCQGTTYNVCVDGSDLNISASNPLKVILADNQSFELDFNVTGCPAVGSCFLYPDVVNFVWSGVGGRIVARYIDGESNLVQSENVNLSVQIPSTGTLDPLDNYKIRAINDSGGTLTLTISPSGTSLLPIGLFINVTGKYQEQQRKIELEKRSWLIY